MNTLAYIFLLGECNIYENTSVIGLKEQCFWTDTMKYASEAQLSHAYMKQQSSLLVHTELKPTVFLICILFSLSQNFSWC